MVDQSEGAPDDLDRDVVSAPDQQPLQVLQGESREQFAPEEVVTELAEIALPRMDEIVCKLVRLGVRMIPAADEVSMTTVTGRNARTLATSGDLAFKIEKVQYRSREKGPCVRSARAGEFILINDIAAESRWPAFRDVALTHGITASLSMPIPPFDLHLVMNCYSRTVFSPTDVEMAELVASWGEVALTNLQLREQAKELRDRTLAESQARKIIEQAKGILMERHDLSEHAAFERMRMLSQSTNRKVRDIAIDVVSGDGSGLA